MDIRTITRCVAIRERHQIDREQYNITSVPIENE